MHAKLVRGNGGRSAPVVGWHCESLSENNLLFCPMDEAGLRSHPYCETVSSWKVWISQLSSTAKKLLKLEALVLWDLLRQSEAYSSGSKRMKWRAGPTLDMDTTTQLTLGGLTVGTSWRVPGSCKLWNRVRRILSPLRLRRKPRKTKAAPFISKRSPCFLPATTTSSSAWPVSPNRPQEPRFVVKS